MLSKVNPDPQLRDILAKALCTLQLSLRGTPFIFQGQELGAANQNFTSMAELRDRVRLVQELDALADQMVAHGIQMAKDYSVMEVEIRVPQTQKVLVANT